MQKDLEHESDTNLSTADKFFSPECQQWAEPLRGWSVFAGTREEGSFGQPKQQGGGEEAKERQDPSEQFQKKGTPRPGWAHPPITGQLPSGLGVDCRIGELYDFFNKGFHRVAVFH